MRVRRATQALGLVLSLVLAPLAGGQVIETFGTTEKDFGKSVVATADGGGLVAGFSGVPSPTRSSLVKLDASGAPQWQKFVGTASPTVSFSFDSVWAATDGGYVATGTQPSSGRNHGWVVKLEASGGVQWQQLFGTVYSDRCRAVCQSKDGAIIVAGLTQLNGSTSPDLWVAKLDLLSGALLWQRAFDGGAKVGEWEEAEAVCATSDGGIAVAGWATTGSLATDRGWIIKLASDGSVVWQKTYAHSKKLELFSIQEITGGGLVAAGFTDDPVSGWYDFLVLKLDSGGTPVWSKTYSGPTDDIAYSIQETPDYGYIVAGETGSAPWVLPYDIWLIKLDSSGTPEWQKAYGGARSEFGGRARRTQDGGYLVTGTQSDDGPSGTKADLFVVKTKSDGSVDPSCTLVRDTAATVSDVAISVATTTRPWYDPGASSTSPPLAAESATFTRSVLCGSGTSGQSFHTVSPCRLIDTRNISSPAFLPGTRRDFLATASCGVSATARAIALNVTVVYPTAPGYLTLFPGDAPTPPVTSTINFLQGQVRANNGVVLLGADGKIGIVNGSTGSTDVVVDIVGYFE